MARTMIGAEELTVQPARAGEIGARAARASTSSARSTMPASPRCATSSLIVRSGEIVGIAGVSGNGQRQLVEVLAGQREAESGEIRVHGEPYHAQRAQEMRRAQDVAACRRSR